MSVNAKRIPGLSAGPEKADACEPRAMVASSSQEDGYVHCWMIPIAGAGMRSPSPQHVHRSDIAIDCAGSSV